MIGAYAHPLPYSATSVIIISFLELRLLETDSATDDAASLTFETVSSLSESATFLTVGARIWAAGAKAPRTDSKPAEEGEEARSATEEKGEEEEEKSEEAIIFLLDPALDQNESATEAAAPFTLSTVAAGTASTALEAAGARAPTTAEAEEEDELEVEFPLTISRNAAVSALACSSFLPVFEAQSTLFHSTFQRPSPFIAKSTSPYLHSGHKLLTAAKNLPTGLPPAPTPVPRPSIQMPQLFPPSHC